MLYLYGDESNTPGADPIWAIGYLFTSRPSYHMAQIAKIRKECAFEKRELKYSSTDYSQILCAVRLLDYFFITEDLFFKILIKDNLYFDPKYFDGNQYKLNHKDMAYVASYSELTRSIKPSLFKQHKKLLNIDDKPFRGNVILPKFLKTKDSAIVQVFRRNSRRRSSDGVFTGVSNMIQMADFVTGIILSFADTNTHRSPQAKKHKNIYRKAVLSKCPNIEKKLLAKNNYYYPSFQNQKINVFYWQKKTSSGKAPS